MVILLSLVFRSNLTIHSGNRSTAAIRVFAAFELALIVATWPLWGGKTEFPEVPMWPIAATTGNWSTFSLLILLMVSAVGLMVCSRRNGDSSRVGKYSAMAALLAGILLVVMNQHRLQPWHWLFLLNVGSLLFVPPQHLLAVMRHTISTVYVCSALSRITPTPPGSATGMIVRQLLTTLGLTGLTSNEPAFVAICHVLTSGELLIGLLLLFRKTQCWGCVGAVSLHALLLLALGPLGLNHHAGVLLWNLCFIFIVPTLFWGIDLPQSTIPGGEFDRRRLATIAVWLFPVSGLFSLADNWPSWQLYSSRPESWILYVHETARSALPVSVQSFISDPAPLDDWCAVKLDRWSLEQTRSPIYPEDRFQFAIIRRILADAPEDLKFRIEISSPETVRWWRREMRQISSAEALSLEQSRFLLGTMAN